MLSPDTFIRRSDTFSAFVLQQQKSDNFLHDRVLAHYGMYVNQLCALKNCIGNHSSSIHSKSPKDENRLTVVLILLNSRGAI